jgi:hypothetical protein
MKKFALLSLFALLFCTVAANAADVVYFYGGNFDPNNPNANGLANETDSTVSGSPYGAATYQNFYVQNSAITVTGLSTSNLISYIPTSGYWEIRSGVKEGSGGTLVASGTASGNNLTHTPTGRSSFGYTEYDDKASGLSVNLAVGQYWMAMVPTCGTCAGRSFNSNTFGLNSVGKQDNNLQFFNSSFFGANFTNANNEGVFQTFSSAVYVAPEPTSMIMLGSGLLAAAGVVRRRLSR